MTFKNSEILLTHCFFLLFLATAQAVARKELQEASPPPAASAAEMLDYPEDPTAVIVIAYASSVTIPAIASILFMKKFIDFQAVILVCGMCPWVSNEAVRSHSAMFLLIQIALNFTGFCCWIFSCVRNARLKNGRSSSEVAFETGAWFYALGLSGIEIALRLLLRDRKFHKVASWYPAAMSLLLFVGNYWSRGRAMKSSAKV
ncbi:unnamed protein product [Cuscuta europaea]|uniref:Uncharacterized protein n=1 Tax=Cuscuta europaea TaxID=41803 RepID=A0A9P0YQJ4_CUSEU|nr:unnamed protein product [Cuscuta europaea]